MSSFGAAFYGAVAQGEAAKDKTRADAAAAAAANALQQRQFEEARGSTGHAVLPWYTGGAEASLGLGMGKLAQSVKDYYGTDQDILNRGAGIAARYRPLLDQGSKAISGIFSGDLERNRLAAIAPVEAARTALADTTASGTMAGIAQVNQRLAALRAGQGYAGGSSANLGEQFRAQIAGNQQAAGARASATLQNQQDRAAIRNQILDLQLRSPELAGALAAEAIKFETLPADVAGAISRGVMSPLDWFRINVGQPPTPVLAPWAPLNVSPWASVAAAGQGNLSAAGNYLANRDLAKRYNAGQNYYQGYQPYTQQYSPYEDQSQYPPAQEPIPYDYGAGAGAADYTVAGD